MKITIKPMSSVIFFFFETTNAYKLLLEVFVKARPFSQIIIKKNCGKKEKETIGAVGDVLCFHNIANHEL